jgi:hypothetical protein
LPVSGWLTGSLSLAASETSDSITGTRLVVVSTTGSGACATRKGSLAVGTLLQADKPNKISKMVTGEAL